MLRLTNNGKIDLTVQPPRRWRFNPEKCLPLQVIRCLVAIFFCCLMILGFYDLMWLIFMPGQYLK